MNTSTRVIEAQPYERFTRAQLSEFEEIFRLFDGDGDGAISREELKKALLRIEHGRHADDADEKGKRERFLGGGITDETVEAMMRSVDEDGSGRIELQEWFNMLALCFFGRGQGPSASAQCAGATYAGLSGCRESVPLPGRCRCCGIACCLQGRQSDRCVGRCLRVGR